MIFGVEDLDATGELGGTQFYSEFKTTLHFSYSEDSREEAVKKAKEVLDQEFKELCEYIDSLLKEGD